MDDDVVVLSSSATRHSCKVCGKGFACGRSLGGHMRSHSLTEVEPAAAAAHEHADADEGDGKIERRWVQNGARCTNGGAGAGGGGGYGLRENPKKTLRLSGSGGDACHDRGDLLSSSCRPVLGRVRRHAPGGGLYDADDAENIGVDLDDDDRDREMLVMAATRRRPRSMRVPAPVRDALDDGPEDVARCLVMLSRDIGRPWNSRRAKDEHSSHKHNYYDDVSDDDLELSLSHDITTKKKRKMAPSTSGEKRSRYECNGCGRAFQSYQALGGHRASHKRINSNCSLVKVVADQPEASIDTNGSFSTASTSASPDVVEAADRASAVAKALEKSTKYVCPVCYKEFGSGQALGGHKRSHSIADKLYGHADRDAGIVKPEQFLLADRFLDLNQPAPGGDDG
ncbi:hypothetical protein E2562_020508 [Oryza meyeriana var. granulata]|uniref:C2H2-type domain-containing protein n=1 Tax=Oryza meyeriana var. granulata TaxID=110450 RepID=A0A6G1EAY0_9ORYZ|nr:hypothetical protein E2562_020508 [Oryza meyeriana var. granulata]